MRRSLLIQLTALALCAHMTAQVNPKQAATAVKPEQTSCFNACEEQRNRGINPAFKQIPPIPLKATITILKAQSKQQNARLVLTFSANQKLGETLTLWAGARKTVLTRTKGSTFSGIVDFDIAAFEAEQKQRATRFKEAQAIPIFQGRQLIRREKVQSINFESFKNIIEIDPISLIQTTFGNPANIDAKRELMVTDLTVVNDPARTFDVCSNAGTPMGIWTFGHLMSEMANQPITGIDPSDFVRHWLSGWETDQSVNGFTVPNRNAGIQQIMNSWPKLPNGKLDISKAPFRLLAIVNRIDLRANSVYGGGNAGEGRFVFGGFNPAAQCSPSLFTVIFEYGIKKSGCAQVHAWAQQWHNLGSVALGPPGAFNVALQAITDQFTIAGADPTKPNGNAINQLRTNEISIGSPWELREFNIVNSGQLELVTVKQTPSSGTPNLNNMPAIRDYVNQFETAILNNAYKVPLTFPAGGPSFLGGSSINNFDFWNGPAPIHNNDARQNFSLGTCNGCHGGETKSTSPPNQFVQIGPRSENAEAQLSDFLTGNHQPKTDPVSGVNREFGDLLRRQTDLDTLLNSSCTAGGLLHELFFRPLNMTH